MSNVIVTLIPIVLVTSTYFIKASSFPKIIFYIIGMVVSFIEILFPFTENNAITPVRTLRCLLIIGYIVSIMLIILHPQKKKEILLLVRSILNVTFFCMQLKSNALLNYNDNTLLSI